MAASLVTRAMSTGFLALTLAPGDRIRIRAYNIKAVGMGVAVAMEWE
jgi:hypothetical protein